MKTGYIIAILAFTAITATFWVSGLVWKNYEVTGFDFNLTDNASKYRISIEQSTPQEGTETLNSSNIAGYRVQEIVRRAAENSSQVYLMPDSTARKISESDYITYRGRSYRTSVEKLGDIGTRIEAELLDSEASFFDPAVIQLNLKAGNDTSQIWGGAPAPFGVPIAENTQGHRFSLWNPKYSQSRAVHTEPLKKVNIINSPGTLTEMEPGETVKESYTIYPYQEIQKGEYTVSKMLEIDGEICRLEIKYKIEFTVQ